MIFAGVAYGFQAANSLEFPMLQDPHQKIGVALIALYAIQLLLGMFIHFIKLPIRGHRPPQNYFHVVLGLAILALAAYQVRACLNLGIIGD